MYDSVDLQKILRLKLGKYAFFRGETSLHSQNCTARRMHGHRKLRLMPDFKMLHLAHTFLICMMSLIVYYSLNYLFLQNRSILDVRLI